MKIRRGILFAYALLFMVISVSLFKAYVEFHELSGRLEKIERLVLRREEADPLFPSECEFSPNNCKVLFGRLLSNPRLFNGKKITVTGVYSFGFEESALYAPGSKDTDSSESAIWISNPVSMKKNMSSVTVTGVFKRGPSGHLGQYAGELENIEMEESQLKTQ